MVDAMGGFLTVLKERDDELADLRYFMDDREGGVRVITGAAGMGKTALLELACEQALARGFNVFRAHAGRLDNDLPFNILSQLMHNTNWQPHLAGTESLSFNERIISALRPDGAELDQRTLWSVLQAWYSLAVEASKSGPVLIAVDDIHQADSPSLGILLQLLHRSGATPISMLVTVSSGTRPADLVALSELRRHPRCRTLRLTPLSQQAIASLLTEQLHIPDARRLAAECHRITGGNPLLVKALTEDRLSMGEQLAPSTNLLTGDAFEHAVFSLVQRIAPLAHELATAVAVLGSAANPQLLGELLGTNETRVAELASALTEAGVLTGDLMFRHPAARRALRQDSTVEADIQFQAAEFHYARDAPAITTAQHLLAAGPRQATWTVLVLQNAARQATAEGMLELGVEFLELALRSCGTEKERSAISVALASAAWQRNPSSVTKYVDSLVGTMEPNAKHVIEALRYMLWNCRVEEAADLLRHLLSTFESLDEDAKLELESIELWLRTSYPVMLDRVGKEYFARLDAHRHSGPATVDARLDTANLLASVLTNEADESTIARAEQLLRRSLVADTTPATMAAATQALLALIYSDQTELARRCYELFMSTSISEISPTWQAKLLTVGAELAMREGNLRLAVDATHEALSVIPLTQWGVGTGLPMSILVEVAIATGDHEEAARLLRQPCDALFHSRYGLQQLHARGRYHLATGAYYAALGDFLHCGQLMTAWNMDLPGLVPWRSSAATAWVRLDNHSQARTLIADELAMIPDQYARSRGITLRAKALLVDPHTARELLSEAVDIFAVAGDKFLHAHALADLARCLKKIGHHSQAEMTQRRATEEFAKNGNLGTWTLLPRHEKPETHNSAQQLSKAELRVASLAANGYTNREIAAQLFITMSTVEQHLTRIYRKLSVRRRTELTEALETEVARPA